MRSALENLRSDYRGFEQLTKLSAAGESCFLDKIEIDMQKVNWFDANMCSPFGAVLYRLSRELNTISLTNIKAEVEGSLARNGFLSNYGRESRTDSYGTTIEYMRLEPQDDRFFGSYIETHLLDKQIPRMSPDLRKKFVESIFEIFSNAAIHSGTKMGIFSCGQFYPKKQWLRFTITDLGVGIRRNVEEKAGKRLSAEKAIAWAVAGTNTTKKDLIPGGLGLKLLREFIRMNKGTIQIASDRGYWEQQQDGQVLEKLFHEAFPGTVVNIGINTSDVSSYCLTSEIRPEEVF